MYLEKGDAYFTTGNIEVKMNLKFKDCFMWAAMPT